MICGVQLRKLFALGVLLGVLLILPPPVSADEATNSTVYTIEQTYQLPNNGTTAVSNVRATLILFDNYTEYACQQVLIEAINVDGIPVVFDGVENTITETGENRIASISLGTINPSSMKTITITNTIKVTQVGPIDEIEVHGSIPDNMMEYTQPIAHMWESDDPAIMAKASELTAGEPNIYYQAEAIFDFVKSYLAYEPFENEHSALWAYNSQRGDCSEFTHLFSALCRAADIPTKFVAGYGYNPLAGEDLMVQGHAFAFVYFPNVGWTPMDLIWGYPQGEFAMLNKDHIIKLMSYGPNLVRGENIRIPGNLWNWYPSELNLQSVSSGQIVRVTEVKPQIETAELIEGDIWEFYVTVANTGVQPVTNINVELVADETYFEVPGTQSIDSLGSGHNQPLTFDVMVKESVMNSTVTARVSYDCVYGTFFDEVQTTVSATLPTETETTTTPTQTGTTTSPTQTGTTTTPTTTSITTTTTSPTQTGTTTSPTPTEGLPNYLILLIIAIVIVGVVAGVVVARLRR